MAVSIYETPESFVQPEGLAQPPEDPTPAVLGRIAITDLCNAIGYNEIRNVDIYQRRTADDVKSIVLYPFPPGFESRHRRDMPRIVENKHRYDEGTEQAIKEDRVVQMIRRTVGDIGHPTPDLVRAYKTRRSIIACMLHFEGASRPSDQ